MNKLYNKHWYIIAKNIDNKFIDLICIDPPYEINYKNPDFEDKFCFELSAKENYRILKSNGNCIVFAGWSNVKYVIDIYESFGFILKNWIIWDRQKGKNPGNNLVSTREDILWFVKSDNYTFNRQYSTIKKKTKGYGLKNGSEYRVISNVWTDISPVSPLSKEYTGYSCQKPIKLYERIIRLFSNENDLCIDYCCGSGGFGVACKNLNRKFILNDNNKKAFNITKMRIKKFK